MIALAWTLFALGVVGAACGAFVCVRALRTMLAAKKKVSAHPLLFALRKANAISRSLDEASRRSADASRRFAAAMASVNATLASAAEYAAAVTLLATTIEDLLQLFVPNLRGEAG